MLPPRDPRGHKGSFGTVLIVGGHASPSSVMIGAPALAALAALRVGCGRCVIAAPATILAHVLTLCPSATGVPLAADDDGLVPGFAESLLQEARAEHAAVIGPGLGDGRTEAELVHAALARLTCPIVLDADGLNAIRTTAHATLIAQHGRVILTPHPGEFRKLAAACKVGVPDGTDAESRSAAALALARATGAIVLLKGATSILAAPNTEPIEVGTPNAVMAVGGSGDVLSGAIAGLIAQQPEARAGSLVNLVHAAVLAHAHAGRAWQAASGAHAGMFATELADHLPGAVDALRRG